MDFNKLMQRMRDLDRPMGEAAVEECGMPMMGGMTPPMAPPMNDQPPPAHPSMSVNLNAQGMDSIESLLKLMTKVNPDMINQPMPAMSIEPIGMPSLTPPGPSISSIGDLGDLDKGPLKMLPDLDKGEPHSEPDADNMGGPSDMDADNMPPMGIQKAMGDRDGDGDHDMKDHDLEKKDDSDEEGEEEADDEEDKKEAWANEPEENYKSVDYMNNQLAGGMNKPKQMHKHSYRQGDNPMTMPEGDLRASIRAELQQRLAEAKGAK
jgi:hypothetical protein